MINIKTLEDISNVAVEEHRDAIKKLMLHFSSIGITDVSLTYLERDHEVETLLLEERSNIDALNLVLEEDLYEIYKIWKEDQISVYLYGICGAPAELRQLVSELFKNGRIYIYENMDERVSGYANNED
jgi:hypothetical protein